MDSSGSQTSPRVEAGNQRPWAADKVERWAIDRLIPYAKNRTHPRPASRIAAVPNGACRDGPIPVVLARLCAVANRRARYRCLLEHANYLDPHRSATGDAIARDGNRDHVYRHWPGRCHDDRRPIGTSRTSGGDPYYGGPRDLRIKPGLGKIDQGAGRPIATPLMICMPEGNNLTYHSLGQRNSVEARRASDERGAS